MTQSFAPYLSQEFKYGTNHALQTLHLTLPHPLSKPTKDQVFLIYIHGGAWRDPSQSSADFAPASSLLLDKPRIRAKIAGIASLNYGLSPYPSQPSQDPSRNYRHPKHIEDVELALHWLWHQYNVGGDDGWEYVLVGHSCGAMMAFQVAMALETQSKLYECMCRPRVTVGIEGIYDLNLLVRNHADVPIYKEFVVGAFGEDEDVWRNVSPLRFTKQLQDLLADGAIAVIAHSPEDELVEQEQADSMLEVLKTASNRSDGTDVLSVVLRGTHDETWQHGHGVQKAVVTALAAVYQDLKIMKGHESSIPS